MLKVPRAAAYLVLVVLVAASVYLVASANGISGLLPANCGRVSGPEPDPQENPQELPPAEGTTGNDPTDWMDDKGHFFVEYRLERERVRSQEIDVLQQLISNPNTSAEGKIDAENRLLKLQEYMELELTVENAIKAQNFEHAIFIMQEEGALVIVDTKDLTSEQILLLAEIAAGATGLKNSQIKISNQLAK